MLFAFLSNGSQIKSDVLQPVVPTKMKTAVSLRSFSLLPLGQAEIHDTTLTSYYTSSLLSCTLFFCPAASFSFLSASKMQGKVLIPSSCSKGLLSLKSVPLSSLTLLLDHSPARRPYSLHAGSPFQQLSCTFPATSLVPRKISHPCIGPRDITQVFQFLRQSLTIHWRSGLPTTHKLLRNRSLPALDTITLHSGEKKNLTVALEKPKAYIA